MTSIAFIGLGNMGGPMAANLVKAGHSVTGFDLVPAALEAAREQGVTIASSAPEAVADVDVVITMLPSGKHVLDAYGTGEGLLAAAKPDTLFIDSSTISVDDARVAAKRANAAGHRSIDAPVSGGVMGASAGTLTFMVGGSEADFGKAQPVLEPMAGRVVHCGEAGAGQAAKVCNNMMLAISMVGVSEAFVLGEKLGLTNQALYDVASTASGQCWALTTNCPVPGPVPGSPANRDYKPGFAVSLMSKDLGLAMDAIDSTGTHSQLGTLVAEIYRKFAEEGGAGFDFSGIINQIRDNSQDEAA
ncbi:3-hydroxyisobutyrate dehydrogenase [Natronoglycomyces albus]|uniref:3-hydroxyisobutyrate dehydrogenase n=1 Tax=Natronoglycomyces albus TaxID=2811108 RepID=A0A895XSV7_9ACTN|nr:3-hydroxyisobutyrate dehydrogenase [Natronoglycomyces albus]QSB05626.1 3-hydroxyisobutyrate dehydrogenase [Natronoglycomyces albus]